MFQRLTVRMYLSKVQFQFRWRNVGRFPGNTVSPSLSRNQELWSRRCQSNIASTRGIMMIMDMDTMIITVVVMDTMIIMGEVMDITEDQTHLVLVTQSPLIPIVKHWRNCWQIFPNIQVLIENTIFPLIPHNLIHTHLPATNHLLLIIPLPTINPPTHIIPPRHLTHLQSMHMLIMSQYLLFRIILRFHLMTLSPVWMKHLIILPDLLTLFMKLILFECK